MVATAIDERRLQGFGRRCNVESRCRHMRVTRGVSRIGIGLAGVRTGLFRDYARRSGMVVMLAIRDGRLDVGYRMHGPRRRRRHDDARAAKQHKKPE